MKRRKQYLSRKNVLSFLNTAVIVFSLSNDAIDFKHIDGGFVFQDADRVGADEVKNAKLVTKHTASASELKDAEIAYKVASSDQIKLCCVRQKCGDGCCRYGDDITCRCSALCT